MTAKIINVQDEKDEVPALEEAARVILTRGMVAVPTESFYGLAVNALDEKALERLLSGKRRGEGHPILILVPSSEAVDQYVERVPERARTLMKAFWPGGVTLVFHAGPRISPLLTAGTGKIGIRLSSHPIATGLARAAGVPITGTSANISGRPPCVTAEEVLECMGQEVDMILDGGKTPGGKGSTVLDVTVSPPQILREGMLAREALRSFLLPPP